MNETRERRTLTVAETGRILGKPDDAIYRALKDKDSELGRIAIRVGGSWLIPKAALMRLLGEQVEEIAARK